MRKSGIWVVALVFFGGTPSSVVQADPVVSCFEPGRNTELCLDMRHMRSLLHSFDTQRELMRVDFAYLSCMASDFDGLIGKIQRTSGGIGHSQALSDIQSLVRLTLRRSNERNLEAFEFTNRIQLHCVRCHSTPTAPGETWGDMSRMGWVQISARCAEVGRNPYVCRQMYGMMAQLQLLDSGLEAGAARYETIASAAGEVSRIARELVALGGVHGGVTAPLLEVARVAEALKASALARNPETFQKTGQVVNSCRECHTHELERE